MEQGAKNQAKGIESPANEKVVEIFPNLWKHVKEVFRTPNQHDKERTSPCHVIIKMPRVWRKEY
jgi:hypothetical protein